jgi:hypothetical protein
MPVVIRNSLALPDLRKSPYHVLLIYDKKLAQKLKNKKNYKKITILFLEDKTIKNIRYIEKEEELKNFFDSL